MAILIMTITGTLTNPNEEKWLFITTVALPDMIIKNKTVPISILFQLKVVELIFDNLHSSMAVFPWPLQPLFL